MNTVEIGISHDPRPGRRPRLYDKAMRRQLARERGVSAANISVAECRLPDDAGLPTSHRVHRRGRPDRLMSCGQMWSDQHPVAGKVGRSDAAERQRLNPEQDQIDAMEPHMRRVAASLDPGIWALSEAKASAGRAAVGAALGQLFLGLAEQELEDGREVGQFFIELPEDPAPHVERLLDYLGERFISITVVTAAEASA